ncbi:MAG: tetratricopeptide repeat protein [Bacteroidia bacterium]
MNIHLRITLIAFLALIIPICAYSQSSKKLIKEAKSLYEQQNFSGAKAILDEVIKLEADNDDALFLRGKTYKALDECAKAVADFQAAASRQQKNADLYYSLAECQVSNGDIKNALISIDRIITLSPKNMTYYHFKERVLMNEKEFDKVIATADQAILMDDEDDYSYFMKGGAADSIGNYSLAETYFKKALELALDDKAKRENAAVLHPYFSGLANVQKALFKNQEALENYNNALKWNSSDIQSLNERGAIHLELKNFPQATADFTQAITLDQKNPEAYFRRGKVNMQLGQFASAINDFNQAIRYDDKNASFFQKRAECYFANADYNSAVLDYKRALELDPSNKELNKSYAEAKQKKYDLNKESTPPKILVISPKLKNKLIEVRKDLNEIEFKAQISDASPIKSIVLDGNILPLKEDEMNPEVSKILNIKDKKEIKIQASDVYLNSIEETYTLERTEVDPPTVNITSPFQTIENELFIENTASIMIEGKVTDESLISSIIINGTSASFPLEMKNPSFQALVNIGTKDTIEVKIADVLGNEQSIKYRLLREDTSGANPMGRTWVVFIENTNYKNLQKLDGPAKDIADMTVALSNYKIDKIITKKDASKSELDKFFSIDLRDQVQKNRVKSLIVWYAGHGKFLNETGYWIPIDGDNYDEYTYYSVNNLRAAMQAYTMVKHVLVISDACESGPAFYMAMRDELTPRLCDDWEVTKFKSAQVLTSSNKELSTDNSLFTQAFANTLNNNPNDCMSIEAITLKVMGIVKQNQKQTPKFGKIKGLDDENGSFFFIKKDF